MVFLRKLHTKYLKVFFVYSIVLAIFIITSFSLYYFSQNKQLYLKLVSLYGVIEFVIISLMFFFYTRLKWVKTIILTVIFLVVFTLLLNHVHFKIAYISSFQVIFTSLILIVYILFFFYSKMRIVSEVPLYQTMSFWIFVAFFLYYTGNFFFFLILGTKPSTEIQTILITVYSGVTILKNILLCVSFKFDEPKKINNLNLSIPTELNLDDLSHINQNSDN